MRRCCQFAFVYAQPVFLFIRWKKKGNDVSIPIKEHVKILRVLCHIVIPDLCERLFEADVSVQK